MAQKTSGAAKATVGAAKGGASESAVNHSSTSTSGTSAMPAGPARRLGRGLSSLLGGGPALKPVEIASVPPLDEDTLSVAPTTAPAAIAPIAPPVAPSIATPAAPVGARAEGATPPPGTIADGALVRVPVRLVRSSPFQPRKTFDPAALAQLSASIAQSGLVQPIVVRRLVGASDGGPPFELVAGERRLRAAQLAGLDEVPAVVRQLRDDEAAEWALVENLQREDLNAMERAHALRQLGERFGLSQELVAQRVGMERSTVANLVRLTELEEEVGGLIAQGKLSAAHGKVLLGLPPGPRRVELAQLAVKFAMPVRKLDGMVQTELRRRDGVSLPTAAEKSGGEGFDERAAVLRDLERQISQHLGTKVRLTSDRFGKRGTMVVEFYGLDHFDGLLRKMGVNAVG